MLWPKTWDVPPMKAYGPLSKIIKYSFWALDANNYKQIKAKWSHRERAYKIQ
jgi:hypothetical protein